MIKIEDSNKDSNSSRVLPEEMKKQFERINQIDCFEFVDGIDTESCGYKYINALNQFRYEYNPYIQLHNVISQRSSGSGFNEATL